MDNIEIVVSDPSITEADQHAVFQLTVELDKRWNQRDAKAFADLFEDDADFRFYTEAWLKGKAAIESFWNGQVFPGLPENMRHVILIKRVRFVASNIAIGDGTLRFVYDLEGEEKVHAEREGTLIAVKKYDHWSISAVRLV